MEVKKGMVCQHFKGTFYLVEDIVINSESQEKMVLYKALNGEGKRYVRPYEMFVSKVDKEKYPKAEQEYRFQPIFELEQSSGSVSQQEMAETLAGLLAHIGRMESRMTNMRNKITNVEKDVKILTNTRRAKKDKESLLSH